MDEADDEKGSDAMKETVDRVDGGSERRGDDEVTLWAKERISVDDEETLGVEDGTGDVEGTALNFDLPENVEAISEERDDCWNSREIFRGVAGQGM